MAFTRRDMIRTGALGGGALLAGVFLSRVTRAATLTEIKTPMIATATNESKSRERAEPGKPID